MSICYAVSTRACRCAECGSDIDAQTHYWTDDDFESFCSHACATSDPTESREQRNRRIALADLQRFILSGALRAQAV